MPQPPVPTRPPRAGRRSAGKPYEGAVGQCVSNPRRNLLDLTAAGAPVSGTPQALGGGPQDSVRVGGSTLCGCGFAEQGRPPQTPLRSPARLRSLFRRTAENGAFCRRRAPVANRSESTWALGVSPDPPRRIRPPE